MMEKKNCESVFLGEKVLIEDFCYFRLKASGTKIKHNSPFWKDYIEIAIMKLLHRSP